MTHLLLGVDWGVPVRSVASERWPDAREKPAAPPVHLHDVIEMEHRPSAAG